MKRVFSSPDSAELGLLKNVLEKAGIRCVEVNGQMAQMIPTPLFQAEVWVEREEDYGEALALIAAWQNPTPASEALWTCSRCGVELGDQFSKCWKCGTPRHAVA